MTSNEPKDKDLVQKFNLEALECNSSLVEKWKQYKKEYEELNTCLEEFPKELSAPILMPLGSKVFVRAQLCNTNEVFIRYDEIFTKQTAYEAKAVCKRHIERCDNMIANLSKEKQFLTDKLCARQEIITDSNQMTEIMEPYDENEHAAWKEKHKQKVKEYKQDLANQEKVRRAKEALEEKEKQNLKECKQDMTNQESLGNAKVALGKEENHKVKECKQDLTNKKNIRKAIETLEKEGVPKIFPDQYKNLSVYDSMLICMGRTPEEVTYSDDSDDLSTYDSCDDDDDDDGDNDSDKEDDIDCDDEDEDSKLEIVFTNDVPETTRNLKKKIVKKVSFNNDVQIKEFEPRPEEHFIRRREETEKPEIIVTELDDIVERVMDTCLEKEKSDDEEEEPLRPISRFKASRNKSTNIK